MLRILIVDDQELVLDLLRDQLKICLPKIGIGSFEIERAENGEEALKKAREFFPNLVITDAEMPKMGGIELVKTLKPEFPDCKFIAISSSMLSYRTEFEEAGADWCTSKPLELALFKDILNVVLEDMVEDI